MRSSLVVFLLLTALAAQIDAQSAEFESGNANEFIDEAIGHWKSYLRESGYDPLIVSSFSKDMITCKNCRIEGLSSIRRAGDVTLNASDLFMTLDLHLGFDTLSADCICKARWSLLTAEGRLTATIIDYSLGGRIEQDPQRSIRPFLSRLYISNEGQLESYFHGSGFIGTLVQWFGQNIIRTRMRSILSDPNEVGRYLNQYLVNLDLKRLISAE